MVPTPAGQFRDRVSILRKSSTSRNELGEVVPTETTIATCWAAVRPVSSKEIEANAQTTIDISHNVRIRYDSQLQILHTDVILFRNRRLSIVDITSVMEADREWSITANEQEA